jgi:peptidoglycan/LPS O-acetylase OafA/YrhL
MQLQKILNKENNNLDIFRLLAACLVIYGHAYALSPEPGYSDIIARTTQFDYSGSLAVKIFFFLSGLVVTNSLLEKVNPIQFVISRFFRVWPALCITVITSALLFGPLLTTLPLSEYFNNKEIFKYIYKNIFLHPTYELPGVFIDNPYKSIVNGSLWIIPYEIAAYLILISLFVLGLFKSRILPIFMFIIILIDPLLKNKLLFTWLPHNYEISLLAPCFAFGSLLAFYKEKVIIDIYVVIGTWVLFLIFKSQTYHFYFLYLAIFISLLYFATLDFVIKLKPSFDISYGIYLWGFPVQQLIASLYLKHGVIFNQITALLISIMLGLLSWHLIEKKCINFGAKLSRRFTSKQQQLSTRTM